MIDPTGEIKECQIKMWNETGRRSLGNGDVKAYTQCH